MLAAAIATAPTAGALANKIHLHKLAEKDAAKLNLYHRRQSYHDTPLPAAP